ncbi:MAG: DUF1573 domain-containing protein [Flavitalea sp.]
MKLLPVALALLIFTATGCKESEPTPTETNMTATAPASAGALTKIEWIDSAKNMGKINEGQKLQIAFRFKNAGDKPLVIQAVRPGCGCTVADYPKEPIAPGKEAVITGSFDSQGREGLQHKEIFVSANTEGTTEHKISFDVEVAKSPVKPATN